MGTSCRICGRSLRCSLAYFRAPERREAGSMMPFYWFVLFISLGFWQQPNTAPFKIVISTDKWTVVSGADVLVNVSLTNTSNRDVEEGVMYKAGIELDSTLRFEVRDDHGKLVPIRAYKHEDLRPGKVVFQIGRRRRRYVQGGNRA